MPVNAELAFRIRLSGDRLHAAQRLHQDKTAGSIEETGIGGAIRQAKGLLDHFHTGECNRMVPGKGRMPWREIAEALRDIDYRETVVMEPFVRMGGKVGSDIKVWRDISNGASSEKLDEDAAESVKFERYMFE